MVALLAAVCGAKAQTWTGETVADGGHFYIVNDKQLGHNVYLKADANGYATTTEASEATLFTFTHKSGDFYVVSYAVDNATYYLGENSGNSSTSTQTEFEMMSQLGTGYYNFRAKDGTNHRYLNIYDNDGSINFPKSATQSQSSEWWKLATEAQMSAYNDDNDGYIRNANANNGMYFWSTEVTGKGLVHIIDNKFGKIFELIGDWNTAAAFTAKMSQTIPNLPAGTYRFCADMMAADATTMTLKAGNASFTMTGTGDSKVFSLILWT